MIMKITSTQLKKLVQEEASKMPLKESPQEFYKKKSMMIDNALDSVTDAQSKLHDLADFESNYAGEIDADVQSAINDLESVEEFLINLQVAVDSMQ